MSLGRINTFLLRRSERKSATRVRQVYVSATNRSPSDCDSSKIYDSNIWDSSDGVNSHEGGEKPEEGKKQVKWASDVELAVATRSLMEDKAHRYYRDKIRRRVLNGSCPKYSQCSQNIHKILFDADVFCEMEANKVRAARSLLPLNWIDRQDCVPILPLDRLITMCRFSPSMYPLWSHFCFNFWIRYDHDIRVEPLIYFHAATSSASTLTTSSSSELSISTQSRCLSNANMNNEALVLKPTGEIVSLNAAATWYTRGAFVRSWLQRTVAQSHALLRTLMRKPSEPSFVERDIVDELCTEVLENEELRFEIRFLTLDDLYVKLLRMKAANAGHKNFCQVIDNLVTYYKACGMQRIPFNGSDSSEEASGSLSSHMRTALSHESHTTAVS